MYDDSFKSRYRNAPIAIYKNINSADTKPHIHSEIEILYIEKGQAELNVGENAFKAAAGDLIFINPLQVHSVSVITKNDYSHKCVCFDTELIADKTFKNALENGEATIKLHFLATDNNVLSELFLKLYSVVEKSGKELLFESVGYISLIFAYILKNSCFESSAKTSKEALFCKRVIGYIGENYQNNITSADIAKEFFYTQSYFCRNFKANFHTSFSNYLVLYRISKAKTLLENTNLKIAEISEACGFESPEYFARCFKNKFEISPFKFRKSQNSTEKQ